MAGPRWSSTIRVVLVAVYVLLVTVISSKAEVHEHIDFSRTELVQYLEEGKDSHLLCQVDANPKPKAIVWYRNNKVVKKGMKYDLDPSEALGQLLEVNNATKSILVVRNARESDAGQYRCQAVQLTELVSEVKSVIIKAKVNQTTEEAVPLVSWRVDGRCGRGYLAPNNGTAECNPDSTFSCCSAEGWCGNTDKHCNCKGCQVFSRCKYDHPECDFPFLYLGKYYYQCTTKRLIGSSSPWCSTQTWGQQREHTPTKRVSCIEKCALRPGERQLQWRKDGRCGPESPLPNGRDAKCDPDSNAPCCSASGHCGITDEHCTCNDCIDYRGLSASVPLPGAKQVNAPKPVQQIINYYAQEDPTFLPNFTVPIAVLTAFGIPKQAIYGPIVIHNATFAGHSGIVIERLDIDLVNLTVEAEISLGFYSMDGDYEWPGYLWSTWGRTYNYLENPHLEGTFWLEVIDGIVQISKMDIDILEIQNITREITGLAPAIEYMASSFLDDNLFMANLLWGMNYNIKDAINGLLKEYMAEYPFPNSTTVLIDHGISLARDFIREKNFDPLRIPLDDSGKLQYTEVIYGLSTVQRHGNVSLNIRNNIFFAEIKAYFPEIRVDYEWKVKVLSLGTSGTTRVTATDLYVTIVFKGDIKLNSMPMVWDVIIEAESVTTDTVGELRIPTKIESLVNKFIAWRKPQLLKKAKKMIKKEIQKRLDEIDFYGTVYNQQSA